MCPLGLKQTWTFWLESGHKKFWVRSGSYLALSVPKSIHFLRDSAMIPLLPPSRLSSSFAPLLCHSCLEEARPFSSSSVLGNCFPKHQGGHQKKIRKQEEESWIPTTPSLTSCVNLSNLLDLSEPWFPHAPNGNNNQIPDSGVPIMTKENICSAVRSVISA
jgi:hypothetical protein